jgi:glycosyltransferase involved in cell wall biosynthesis
MDAELPSGIKDRLRRPLQLLMVAHAFPPSSAVGGIRITNFCKYLPEFDVQPIVLTVQSRFHEELGPMAAPLPIRVVRTVQSETILDRYARWRARRPNAAEGAVAVRGGGGTGASSVSNVRRHLLSILQIPDRNLSWYFPALRTARHLVEGGEIDAVFSSAPPFTAHLIARAIKKKFNIPWIADFRDPWFNNQIAVSLNPPWFNTLSARMEESCVRAADLVISNTEWQTRDISQRYATFSRQKFVTLTNGYDDFEVPANQGLGKKDPVVCLHLGDIYQGRRIDTFCAAVSILIKVGQLRSDAVRVLFVGKTDSSQIEACRRVAGELIDSGVIQFHKRVEKSEADKLLWDADQLLVFQGRYRAQIPLKFYEYLATGKPIFAVGQPGALSEIMAQTGAGVCCDEDDPNVIAKEFLGALAAPAQPAEVVQRRWVERFHFRSLSRKLSTWIKGLDDRDRLDGRNGVLRS